MMFDDNTDPRSGGGPGQPQNQLIGYSDDGSPVYSIGGQGQYVIGPGGMTPYTGNLNQQPGGNGQTPTPAPTPDPTLTFPGGAPSTGPTFTPAGPTQTPTSTTTGGGGMQPSPADLTSPFGVPFTPPTPTPMPGAPTPPTIPAFTPPTMDQAMNDPGYQFSAQQGQRDLTNWLAAHGTFNDSSAANALYDYGANAAQTQYGNVWGRQYNAYNTNVQTQYLDPWQQNFQNYSTTAPLVQHANDMNWQNSFNTWLQNWNVWKDQRDSTFDKQFKVATS